MDGSLAGENKTSFRITHGEPKDTDFPAAKTWITEGWPRIISKFSPENVYNANESELYYRALPKHTCSKTGVLQDAKL